MTLFAPRVSVQLKPTAAAKLLQLLAFPSRAPEKRGEQKARRFSMSLLLRGWDGARLLPRSAACIRRRRAVSRENCTEWQAGDSKLQGRWRTQKQIHF